MEGAQSEVHAMDGNEAVAVVAGTGDGHVVERHVLQLLDGPVGEHEPGDDGVDEEDERVGDSGRDAVVTLAARAAHGRAGGSTAA